MADSVTLPLTGTGDATALVSTEEVTTLNGGAVSAQHVQRVVPAARTADGVAKDIGHAEDAAHASGDAGIMALAVRKDTAAALAGTDGDYAPLEVDADGKLHVNPGTVTVSDGGGSVTVDGSVTANAGTNLNTSALALESGGNLAAIAASASVLDDWDESDRAKVNPIVGQAGVAAGSGTVGATTQRVVLATDVALPAGTNNIGDVDVASVPAPLSTTGGGTEAAALRVTIASDSTGVVSIDDNGASITVDGTVTANAGTGTHDVGGDTAHDAADAGKPVSTGFQARTSNPTAVGDGDRVRAIADDIGRQVVVLNQVRDLVVHQHTEIASSSSETTILTAGAAGVFHDLVALVLTNQTATAVVATIKDATAGTTRMKVALAANGGAVLNFAVPVPQAAAANNWTITLSNATTTVDVFVQAVKNL